MTIKVAINGYGRIGRCILRAIYESNRTNEIEVVAINDMGRDLAVHAHLTQYDSVHGLFNHKVQKNQEGIEIDGHKIRFFAERDPNLLPWAQLGVDVVLECTGVFASKAKSSAHLHAGAKKVLISAPGGDDVDATIVYGVNHQILTKEMSVVSNASCTTNCLAPIAQILDKLIGIESGLMTTIHSYTNDQVLTDSYHSDLHRARSATMSMIPTKTGAAKSVGLVLPELHGKLDGLSIRVPTPNVSLVDFTFIGYRDTTVEEINHSMIQAANGINGGLKGILAVNHDPLVSIDFNHNAHSSIFDLMQTRVSGRLVKVFSWYDNEWGFSNRMLDVVIAMMNAR
jgi:glyceraldehyde 3-phosphate dehydrogenase